MGDESNVCAHALCNVSEPLGSAPDLVDEVIAQCGCTEQRQVDQRGDTTSYVTA